MKTRMIRRLRHAVRCSTGMLRPGTLTLAALASVVTLAVTATPSPAATGASVSGPAPLVHARTLSSWKAPAFAESMAPDRRGGYVVSVTTWGTRNVGQLWQVRADGARTAFGPAVPLGPCSMLLGVTTVRDAAYVAVYDYEGSDCEGPSVASGVLRVTRSGSSRLTTLPAGSWPNGIVAQGGHLYVTDSAAGAIWRLSLGGGRAPKSPWFSSPMLRGTTAHPIGANGIVYRQEVLYVASSGRGLVLALKLNRSGNVRSASVFARDAKLVTVDGLTFDPQGRLWATVNTGSLVTISSRGTVVRVPTPRGALDYPTQLLVVGHGHVVVENGSFDAGTPSLVDLSR